MLSLGKARPHEGKVSQSQAKHWGQSLFSLLGVPQVYPGTQLSHICRGLGLSIAGSLIVVWGEAKERWEREWEKRREGKLMSECKMK